MGLYSPLKDRFSPPKVVNSSFVSYLAAIGRAVLLYWRLNHTRFVTRTKEFDHATQLISSPLDNTNVRHATEKNAPVIRRVGLTVYMGHSARQDSSPIRPLMAPCLPLGALVRML